MTTDEISRHIDLDALSDPNDHRGSIAIYPAVEDDKYIFVHRTADSAELYTLSYRQGGDILKATSRAFRQATSKKGFR